MMSFVLRTALWSERIVVRIGQWSSWLILPLIAVIMYDVISRKFQFIQQAVLNSPLYTYISPTKLQELEWHLHAAIFLLAFGYGYFRDVHVRVDLVRETLPSRSKAWMEFAGLLLLAIPYFCVMIYFAWEFVSTSFMQGEGSDALTGLPHRWIIKSFLLIGLMLLLMSVLSTTVRLWAYLKGSPSAAAQAACALDILRLPADERPDPIAPMADISQGAGND